MQKLLFPAAALALSTLARADVLNVRGPSADHAEISLAVAASAPGDVIRVWPGTYQPFSVKKTLTIAAVSGSVNVAGTVRIKDLGAAQHVEFSGIKAKGTDGNGLVISDCLGSVRLRNCAGEGALHVGYYSYSGMLILESEDVVLVNCVAKGGLSNYPEGGDYGGIGLETGGSNVSIWGGTFQGSSGTTEDDPGGHGGSGGDGILATNGGTLWVSGSHLIGGHGANADPQPDWFGGGYGVGGSGGWGLYHWLGTEVVHVDCTYQPGTGGWGVEYSGSPGQDTSGVQRQGPARSLRTPALSSDTGLLQLTALGSPGDEVWVRVSDRAGYLFKPRKGPLQIDSAPNELELWFRLGTIPGTGTLTRSLLQEDLPAFDHRTVYLQGLFVGNQHTRFGGSTWTTVLDSSW